MKDKPTTEQLVDLIDDELDITIGRDVVYGLYYEYKQLQQENQELKKQLEEYKKMHKDMARFALDNEEKIDNLEFQQKQFIDWLEENYETTQDIWYIKILNKYKEMIGDKE